MDIEAAVASVEASLTNQLVLAGNDPEIAALASAVIAALQPAIRQAAMELGQQAATEVSSQLPDHEVSVVIQDGDPTIQIRQPEGVSFSAGDYEARLTLRLPDTLKEIIESQAGESGDSVNAWVVKNLSSKAYRKTSSGSGRMRTRIET